MSPSQQQHAVSLVPTTFVEGGLWDDLDVEIGDIAWLKFNFAKEGQPANLKLALGLELYPLEGLEPGKEPYQQMFSGGDLKYFVPSADDNGAYAIPVGDKQALNSNTNAAMFLISLFECATPEQRAWLESSELASGNCKAITGLQLHLKRMPQKERKGLSSQEPDAREKTILLATNIIALPGEAESVAEKHKAAGKTTAGKAGAAGTATAAKPVARPALAKPAAKPAPVSTAAAGGKTNGAALRPAPKPAATAQAAATASPASEWTDAKMAEKGYEALVEILNANDGVIEFAEVPKQAFRTEALKPVPPKIRQAICALMYDENWIGGQDGVTYDATVGTVSVA